MTAVPAHLRGLAFGAARASFVDGLNSILLIAAVVAFAAAVLTFVLIRQRDFVDVQHGTTGRSRSAGRGGRVPRDRRRRLMRSASASR